MLLELALKGHGKAERSRARVSESSPRPSLQHLDLAQAVSEALNRNALALGKSRLEPSALELLRTPPKAEKKE